MITITLFKNDYIIEKNKSIFSLLYITEKSNETSTKIYKNNYI